MARDRQVDKEIEGGVREDEQRERENSAELQNEPKFTKYDWKYLIIIFEYRYNSLRVLRVYYLT